MLCFILFYTWSSSLSFPFLFFSPMYCTIDYGFVSYFITVEPDPRGWIDGSCEWMNGSFCSLWFSTTFKANITLHLSQIQFPSHFLTLNSNPNHRKMKMKKSPNETQIRTSMHNTVIEACRNHSTVKKSELKPNKWAKDVHSDLRCSSYVSGWLLGSRYESADVRAPPPSLFSFS